VSFEGRLEVLLRKRVPVRAVAVEDGVIIGQPEPEADLQPARRLALL
jgi:hypothetical protein